MSKQLDTWLAGRNFLPSLFASFDDDFFNRNRNQAFPASNIVETETEFKLELSVPGFNKEDVKVEIDKNVLIVSAKTEHNKEEKQGEKVLRREFSSNSFSRSYVLPENIDAQAILANQKDGVLQITLPKLVQTETGIKQIEVK